MFGTPCVPAGSPRGAANNVAALDPGDIRDNGLKPASEPRPALLHKKGEWAW